MAAATKEMIGGCNVCSFENGWPDNQLVYCDGDGCSVAVHQECYGILHVPAGSWYCCRCQSQERAARVKCELCPLKDGAFKRTDTGAWGHVICALYIREANFEDVQKMERIVVSKIPTDRFNKLCNICNSPYGVCIPCSKAQCKFYFHVTCGQAHGLLCEEERDKGHLTYLAFCPNHVKKVNNEKIKPLAPHRPIPTEPDNPQPRAKRIRHVLSTSSSGSCADDSPLSVNDRPPSLEAVQPHPQEECLDGKSPSMSHQMGQLAEDSHNGDSSASQPQRSSQKHKTRTHRLADSSSSSSTPTSQLNPFGTVPIRMSEVQKEVRGSGVYHSSLPGPPRPGDHHSSAQHTEQRPRCFEELLERQWDDGASFLMGQAQHFDVPVAALLSSLHMLQRDNTRLEQQVNELEQRRLRLLTVNSRLQQPIPQQPVSNKPISKLQLRDSTSSAAETTSSEPVNSSPLETDISSEPRTDASNGASSQPTSNSTVQPGSNSASQPVSNSITRSVSSSSTQSVSLSAQAVSNSVPQPVSNSVSQPVSNSAPQPVSLAAQSSVQPPASSRLASSQPPTNPQTVHKLTTQPTVVSQGLVKTPSLTGNLALAAAQLPSIETAIAHKDSSETTAVTESDICTAAAQAPVISLSPASAPSSQPSALDVARNALDLACMNAAKGSVGLPGDQNKSVEQILTVGQAVTLNQLQSFPVQKAVETDKKKRPKQTRKKKEQPAANGVGRGSATRGRGRGTGAVKQPRQRQSKKPRLSIEDDSRSGPPSQTSTPRSLTPLTPQAAPATPHTPLTQPPLTQASHMQPSPQTSASLQGVREPSSGQVSGEMPAPHVPLSAPHQQTAVSTSQTHHMQHLHTSALATHSSHHNSLGNLHSLLKPSTPSHPSQHQGPSPVMPGHHMVPSPAQQTGPSPGPAQPLQSGPSPGSSSHTAGPSPSALRHAYDQHQRDYYAGLQRRESHGDTNDELPSHTDLDPRHMPAYDQLRQGDHHLYPPYTPYSSQSLSALGATQHAVSQKPTAAGSQEYPTAPGYPPSTQQFLFPTPALGSGLPSGLSSSLLQSYQQPTALQQQQSYQNLSPCMYYDLDLALDDLDIELSSDDVSAATLLAMAYPSRSQLHPNDGSLAQ